MSTLYDGPADEERALNAYIKLQRAADAVAKRCRAFEDAELTESQFGALDALYHLGPLHQNTIGEKILKSKANITTVVDNLVKRGLVERRRDPDDRRCHLVDLTDRGHELFEAIFPMQVQCIMDAIGVLSADEQNRLAELCKKVGTTEPDNSNHTQSGGGDPS